MHARLHSGAYRATPSRRIYIPKADGRQRPLIIASFKDKIVQQAAVTDVNAGTYWDSRTGFSRNVARKMRWMHSGSRSRGEKVNWLLDADSTSLFDEIEHGC